MSEDKSDTYGNNSSVIESKELSERLTQKYPLTKPLQQMSVPEFLRTAIWHDWNKELKLRRGNSNTANPTHLILPNGTLEIYISNEQTRCGRIQLLYWYFKQLYGQIQPDSVSVFDIKNGKIIENLPAPLNMDMDENDNAMHYAKIMLKILR
ncbi:MAG: hypothetical protein K2M99_03680 [Treponemataceae bacterium]|nr:hypothetical protein [Treponemataceae bacterium]